MLCKRRNVVTRKGKKLPLVVLPQRQCITQGPSKSMSHHDFSAHLAEFADQTFMIDRDFWIDYSHLLPKECCTPQVNPDNLQVRTYPVSHVYGNQGLPLFLYEWDWESFDPDEAFYILRSLFFAPDFYDPEGEFQLVEKLPADKKSGIQSHTICRWVWNRNPRPYFTERDWVEYYGVDTNRRTIISRSTLHNLVEEFDWTPMRKLLGTFLPIGTIRGQAFFAMRISPPRPGKKGCLLENLCWNSVGGVIDAMTIYMTQVWQKYFEGIMSQLSNFDKRAKQFKASSSPIAAFDLL